MTLQELRDYVTTNDLGPEGTVEMTANNAADLLTELGSTDAGTIRRLRRWGDEVKTLGLALFMNTPGW